jgi:hypothetical protein
MLQFILYALLIWFLYNLIFKVILPVYKTTRQVKKRFNEMRQQMEDNQRQQDNTVPPQASPKKSAPAGDYIDFEDVK